MEAQPVAAPDPAPRSAAVQDALRQLASTDAADRGAVYTRRPVVDALLDLVGHTPDQPLWKRRLLEPSFGRGDVLVPAVERLLQSARGQDWTSMLGAIRAVEVHPESFATGRDALANLLQRHGLKTANADALLSSWLRCDDFLLTDLQPGFDAVVGNPPYVRQERIPPALLAAYKRRYRTIFARADLYVPFYERGLDLLGEGGLLGFVCTNRWFKNRYGGPLRARVAADCQLVCVVDLVEQAAFTAPVRTYPALTVLKRGPPGPTRVACRPDVDTELSGVVQALLDPTTTDRRVRVLDKVAVGRDPWILEDADQLKLLRRLEAQFPVLEDAGCKVGIGVATGRDRLYIGPLEGLPVEPERRLPLVVAADLQNGQICWAGLGVINPFEDDGQRASLDAWPRFGSWVRSHEDELRSRHIAQRSGDNWYRTIDRIWPELVSTPKLLIPDIQGEQTVVLDKGRFYPHHNLYWVTSQDWDLVALQAVLRSSLALLFVASYGTTLTGGYLRFQAQVLRRMRLPLWQTLSAATQQRLHVVAQASDLAVLDAAVAEAFGLSAAEMGRIQAIAERARVGPPA